MSKGTVLITGGSGFIGAHLIKTALKHGFDVRASVRTESSAKKIEEQFPEYKGRISYTIVPDMTKVESYETAMEGVTGILHAASPFILKPQDNVKDLLEPAINGVLTILNAAKKWGSATVKRVVVTSSHASVVDIDKGKRPGYVYDEKDWNPVTYEEAAVANGVVAYCASKALAERAAWKWFEENPDVPFDLVTITPPWVFGPYATDLKSTKHLSESVGLLWGMVDAKEIPPFDFGGYADARELAEAHVRALEVPEAGGQRFWVGQGFQYQLAADAGREIPALHDRLPEGHPGHLEDVYKVDGSKATRVLGLKYGTLSDTVKDMYNQLLRAEQVEASAA